MKNLILTFTVLAIFFIFSASAYENKIYSVHFVDEEDIFASAKYILNGEKLYLDLFTQHQPLSYLISAQIQNHLKLNSLPRLVKRHREFIIAYSFLWSLLIAGTVGIWTLGFIIPLEITKHYFYGNLFLSESLSVYPFIFLTLLILVHKHSSKYIKAKSFLIGFLALYLALLLITLWPALIFLLLIFIVRSKRNFKISSIFLLAGFLPLFLYASQFVSWRHYLFEVFIVTQKYYLAPLAQSGEKFSLLGFFAPLLSFFWTNINSPILRIIQSMSLLYLMLGAIILIRKKGFLLFLVASALLGFTHLRFVSLEKSFYNGFHLLPWYGLLLVFIFYLFTLAAGNRPKMKIFAVSYFIIIPIFIFLPVKNYFLILTDRETDAYVNFSRPFDFGEAVRIMKSGTDRLFAVPDHYLIYWQAGISHFDGTTSYYPWMQNIPSLADEINRLFTANPPEFFYCHCSQLDLVKYLPLYHRMLKDNQATDLYVLKSKSKTLIKSQWDSLKYYHFSLASGA